LFYKNGRDEKRKTSIAFWLAILGGSVMSFGALSLNFKMDLWTSSSGTTFVRFPVSNLTTSNPSPKILRALAAMIPSRIYTAFSEINLPDPLLWILVCLSTGVFSIAVTCLGIRRNRAFSHEWIGIFLSLGFGAFLGFAPQEEFLVLLPLTVSVLLIITRVAYPSSWDGTSMTGANFEVNERGDNRKVFRDGVAVRDSMHGVTTK
jgi:hypothetical protein